MPTTVKSQQIAHGICTVFGARERDGRLHGIRAILSRCNHPPAKAMKLTALIRFLYGQYANRQHRP